MKEDGVVADRVLLAISSSYDLVSYISFCRRLIPFGIVCVELVGLISRVEKVCGSDHNKRPSLARADS